MFRTYLNSDARRLKSAKPLVDSLGEPNGVASRKGSERKYSCSVCYADFAIHSDLISKRFQSSRGQAYLFDKAVNVYSGPIEEKLLLSGTHHICNIHCKGCEAAVGWKYVRAQPTSQRYKEGKYILECVAMHKDNNWGGM
ncbi:protein yippee-like 3 [Sycon ciliatum]|uniref:protein yippee-like 3 n=1 Tax=Sycon ciliatum TaxID=27933 RepID=UPI0020AD393D|eukprot:scpid97521/ scgid28607/ Protein yippee-like 3 &gt; Protein yippee-like 3; Small ubiquitinated apoptotic protein &gt; Protein yippee-like 3 &gt; Protein yippee-like 3